VLCCCVLSSPLLSSPLLSSPLLSSPLPYPLPLPLYILKITLVQALPRVKVQSEQSLNKTQSEGMTATTVSVLPCFFSITNCSLLIAARIRREKGEGIRGRREKGEGSAGEGRREKGGRGGDAP
jgi:hypothetical protein